MIIVDAISAGKIPPRRSLLSLTLLSTTLLSSLVWSGNESLAACPGTVSSDDIRSVVYPNSLYTVTENNCTAVVDTGVTISNTSTGSTFRLYNYYSGLDFTNNGTVSANSTAVWLRTGQASSFVNNGTISGDTTIKLGDYGGNSMSIIQFTNTGTISGDTGIYLVEGTIGTLTNSGTISGSGSAGIYNEYGTITTIDNSAGGTISRIYNEWFITSINNAGTISDITQNNWFGGTIGTITNTGSISNILNYGGITLINNTGGTIDNLTNKQVGLSFQGNLPSTYTVYVFGAGTTGFGTTSFSSPMGAMTIAVTGNFARDSSMLGIISGVYRGSADASVTNDSQAVYYTYGGTTYRYIVTYAGDGVWDLIYRPAGAGPDATNTSSAISTNSQAVRGLMDRRLTGLAQMSSYDCQTFDRLGFCVSFQARYTGSDGMNEGAGVLTAAYKPTEDVRIGGFVDHKAAEREPTGIRFSNELPTFGAFVGYSQNRDGTGLQGKALGAFQNGKATITRTGSTDLDTEAGAGKAGLNSRVLYGELGYGFATAQAVLATPYVGIRYTTSTRSAYGEETVSGSVDYPISYDSYHQRLTTAVTGIRLAGMLTEKIGYQVGAGLEHDLRRETSKYAGTSSITDLESFSLTTEGPSNRTRGFGSVGLHYQVEKNQRLTGSVGVRHQAYASQPSVSATAGYQLSF